MPFQSVIDMSAFIWDRKKFDKDVTNFHILSSQLVKFISIFEKEKVNLLLRNKLLLEMLQGFPSNITTIPKFYELTTSVFAYLSYTQVIEFDAKGIRGIKSKPDIIYHYYNNNVRKELRFLISEIHRKTNKVIYFTFDVIWDKNVKLNTLSGINQKTYDTVIYTSDEALVSFFSKYKKVFNASIKHDRVKGHKHNKADVASKLSCYNGKDTDAPQNLLDTAILGDDGDYYNYDDENEVFINFKHTEKNIYHAFDRELNDMNIPNNIRKHFHK